MILGVSVDSWKGRNWGGCWLIHRRWNHSRELTSNPEIELLILHVIFDKALQVRHAATVLNKRHLLERKFRINIIQWLYSVSLLNVRKSGSMVSSTRCVRDPTSSSSFLWKQQRVCTLAKFWLFSACQLIGCLHNLKEEKLVWENENLNTNVRNLWWISNRTLLHGFFFFFWDAGFWSLTDVPSEDFTKTVL